MQAEVPSGGDERLATPPNPEDYAEAGSSAAPRAAAGRKRRAPAAAAAAAVVGRGGRGSAGRGRGRGQRQRGPPEPPPPPAEEEVEQEEEEEREEQSEGDSGSREGSREEGSEEEGSREEEEVVEEEEVLPPPQPTLEQKRATALHLLLQLGVPQPRAERALEETEQAHSEGEVQGWADEAQVWLACMTEVEDERDQMAAAMEVSLAEEEERKAQVLPLEERPAEKLLKEFTASQLLQQLGGRYALASLLERPPLREPLLHYLKLEKRCQRWYPCSRHYWAAAAEQLLEPLGPPLASPAGATPAVHAAAAAAAAAAGDTPPRRARPAPAPIGTEASEVLAAAVQQRREEVEAVVYAMPTADTPRVPLMFSEAAPPPSPAGSEHLSDGEPL